MLNCLHVQSDKLIYTSTYDLHALVPYCTVSVYFEALTSLPRLKDLLSIAYVNIGFVFFSTLKFAVCAFSSARVHVYSRIG